MNANVNANVNARTIASVKRPDAARIELDVRNHFLVTGLVPGFLLPGLLWLGVLVLGVLSLFLVVLLLS